MDCWKDMDKFLPKIPDFRELEVGRRHGEQGGYLLLEVVLEARWDDRPERPSEGGG
jgi:hypothetical protein